MALLERKMFSYPNLHTPPHTPSSSINKKWDWILLSWADPTYKKSGKQHQWYNLRDREQPVSSKIAPIWLPQYLEFWEFPSAELFVLLLFLMC